MNTSEMHRTLNLLAQTDEHSWRVASNGAGKLNYFVMRNDSTEYLYSADDKLIRYTATGACKKALALNTAEGRLTK